MTMQLWQFLLELLTNIESTDKISWCGQDGEFVLHKPDEVAKLWGDYKKKPNMDYRKMSRALRYYYGSEKMLIKKENGKKYMYKFEIDLKEVLGYNSAEIQEQMRFAKESKAK